MSKETLNKISAVVIIGMGVTFVVFCVMSELRSRAFDKELKNVGAAAFAEMVKIPDDDTSEI